MPIGQTSDLFGRTRPIPKTPQERFEEFHRAHPEIYRRICFYARDAKRRGFEHYSMRTIWELIRWERSKMKEWYLLFPFLRGDDQDPYRFNNNYAPFYARLVMVQEPDLKGFFEVREVGLHG